MKTSQSKGIREWLAEGAWKKATHMILLYDAATGDAFPRYVFSGEEVFGGLNESERGLVVEVYSYALDLDEQLAEGRSYHPECSGSAQAKTFCWNVTDVMIVAKAEGAEEAREIVKAKFLARGLLVPEGLASDPEVLADGDVVWCWS